MYDILTQALAATMIVKVLIDMWRYYYRYTDTLYVPSYVYPIAAVILGIGICQLLAVASGEPYTPQVIAQNVVAGILAAGNAIGVTELQKRG